MKQRYIFPYLIIFAVGCQNVSEKNVIKDNWSETKIESKIQLKTDSQIQAMINEISVDSLKHYVEAMVSFGTRHSLSDTVSDTRGIGAARRWVKDKFESFSGTSNNRMTVELDPFIVEKSRRIPEAVTMKNVLATLKGTDPTDDRVFIVSGHLDSRASDAMNKDIDAPGANDDASGVALVLELARIMSKKEFPSTIIFMAVSGEEQGLFGARHMAEKCKAEEINVVAMLNNDIVGNTLASNTNLKDSTRVRVFSETIPAVETESEARSRKFIGSENDSKSRQLARYIKKVGESYVKDFEVTLNYRIDRYLRGGDHTPFSQNGFTAIRFCEINENFTHQHQDVRVEDGVQYGDLIEFMDFKYLSKVTSLNLAALANLALAPYSPDSVALTVDLNNNTTLTWVKPKGRSPKGYNILIRETYQSHWQEQIYVEDTTVTIPYSKDNYFFAVESVDKQGHASLSIVPLPKRR